MQTFANLLANLKICKKFASRANPLKTFEFAFSVNSWRAFSLMKVCYMYKLKGDI